MKEVSLKEVLSVVNMKLEDVEVMPEQLSENLSSLGMDSFAFIQIIVDLEEKFDCEIPDSKLMVSEMDTVEKIMNVLQELYDAENYTE